MPDDVQAALERFQLFLSGFRQDEIIDSTSGFSASDATLLMGEVESAMQHRRIEQGYPAE